MFYMPLFSVGYPEIALTDYHIHEDTIPYGFYKSIFAKGELPVV